MDKKEERPADIPLCPKTMDKKEERPADIPLCPKTMDKKEERPYGHTFMSKIHGQERGNYEDHGT